MTETTIHPAIQANINSIKHAMAKDKDAWLALYRDDAVLRDPVGVSPLDPTGKGHHGKAAIAKFYDMIIANSNLTMIPGKRIASGASSCAVPMKAINDLGGGIKTEVDMIAIYEVDEQGLIISMSAYWDWDVMQAQLKKLGFA
jgi:steroid Delta-isomerase